MDNENPDPPNPKNNNNTLRDLWDIEDILDDTNIVENPPLDRDDTNTDVPSTSHAPPFRQRSLSPDFLRGLNLPPKNQNTSSDQVREKEPSTSRLKEPSTSRFKEPTRVFNVSDLFGSCVSGSRRHTSGDINAGVVEVPAAVTGEGNSTGGGTAVVTGGGNTEVIQSADGPATVTGGGNTEVIQGADGPATVTGGGNTEVIQSADGPATVTGGGNTEVIQGADGPATVTGGGNTEVIQSADGVGTSTGGGHIQLGGGRSEVLIPASDSALQEQIVQVLKEQIEGFAYKKTRTEAAGLMNMPVSRFDKLRKTLEFRVCWPRVKKNLISSDDFEQIISRSSGSNAGTVSELATTLASSLASALAPALASSSNLSNANLTSSLPSSSSSFDYRPLLLTRQQRENEQRNAGDNLIKVRANFRRSNGTMGALKFTIEKNTTFHEMQQTLRSKISLSDIAAVPENMRISYQDRTDSIMDIVDDSSMGLCIEDCADFDFMNLMVEDGGSSSRNVDPQG